MPELVGYAALGLNLFSMYSQGEYRLRVFSVLADFLYVIYGVLIHALPLVIGCTLALILHIYRLHHLKKTRHKGTGVLASSEFTIDKTTKTCETMQKHP